MIVILILYYYKNDCYENFSNSKEINNIQQNNIPNLLPEYVNKINYKPQLLASKKGKFCFKKPVLLYDGIWGPKCENNICSWSLNSEPEPEVYCTDKLLKLPEKEYPIGGFITLKDNCKRIKSTSTKICCQNKCGNDLIRQP